MKAKEVWVIVPFSRPQHLKNVLDNFSRQDFHNKRLIIVENGDAVGACKTHGIEPDLLITSDNHQAAAKNAGIQAIKDQGGGFWATYDDDDYYGPHYLSEMVESSDKGDVIGKGDLFVRLANGHLFSFQGIACEEYSNFVHGPTICSWAENHATFPNTGQIGEDCAMVRKMIEEGGSVWATSQRNFVFQRYPSADHHTWKISDNTLIESLMCGMGLDPSVKDYGENVSYDFVNGLIAEPEHELVRASFNDEEKLAEIDKTGKSEEFIKGILMQEGFLKEGESPDKLRSANCTLLISNTFKGDTKIEQVSGDDAYTIEEGCPAGRGEP